LCEDFKMADENSIGERLKKVRLLAMDVDGVLTDGRIVLVGTDAESKEFHILDGLGIQLALNGGLIVAWISGRNSALVERRARELGVTHLYQTTANKSAALAELIASYNVNQAQIAFIGDDLNDIPAFSLAGVKFAPSNAVAEIKALADFVTEKRGGEGAVREVCDVILKAQDSWNDAVTRYLSGLLQKTNGNSQVPN
jgi:3-deoxy-D-manno-octulosonate 8-phosphate phosphatase (KDO 8-P phosphatase)